MYSLPSDKDKDPQVDDMFTATHKPKDLTPILKVTTYLKPNEAKDFNHGGSSVLYLWARDKMPAGLDH